MDDSKTRVKRRDLNIIYVPCTYSRVINLPLMSKHHVYSPTLFNLMKSSPRGIVLSVQTDTKRIHLKPDKRIPAEK